MDRRPWSDGGPGIVGSPKEIGKAAADATLNRQRRRSVRYQCITGLLPRGEDVVV